MKRTVLPLGLVALMVAAAGCGNSKTADSLLNNSEPVAAIPEVSVSPLPSVSADPAKLANQPLPVPALIPPTLTPQRLPQINAGRSDPFAAIAVDPIVVPAPATVPSAIQPLTSQPVVALQPIPLQPQAAIPQPVAVAPALAPIPQAIAPTAPQDTVRVSGVVHVGDRLSAIVELPGARGSQYISEGEYFDNGRILVKRIDVSSGEPRVILEHNGVETVRMVGSSGALMGAL